MEQATFIVFTFFVGGIYWRHQDKVWNFIAASILIPFMWVIVPLVELIFFGAFYCFGIRDPWRYTVVPRFRRIRDRSKRLWRWVRGTVAPTTWTRSVATNYAQPTSKFYRIMYTIMLMSWDEFVEFKDDTTPYRSSGEKVYTVIHHASPLERIFGVGFWPWT
jgi:hypothetical protein